MKILHTCTRFPPAPGGVESHVLNVARELISRKHSVNVYTTDLYMEIPFTPMKEWEPVVEGVPVRRFKAYSLHGNMHYVFVPSMTKALLSAKADIIHAHSYGYFQVNVSALNRKLKTVPFVLTPHFHPEWSMWGGQKRKKIRKVYDKIFATPVIQAADILIAHSRFEIKLMQEVMNFDPDRVRYIPAGIDFTKFKKKPGPELFRNNFNIKSKFILFVGRLASNKGLMVLADAAAAVLKEYPDVKFVLVGEDESMKEKLEKKLKATDLLSNFLFTGHIDDENVFRSAYGACELLVLPSEYEAFGLVLAEAMAAGKPVVATRVGGVPEVLGKNKTTGILVDYGDPDGLADAVMELLSDPAKRNKMGTAGRKRVKENFTWPAVVNQIEKVYRELLG